MKGVLNEMSTVPTEFERTDIGEIKLRRKSLKSLLDLQPLRLAAWLA